MSNVKNIGILASEIYFPSYYILQSDLEIQDNVSKGKYTIGLGQKSLSFITDNEDIYSIALTVVYNLMKKYNIDYKNIGRLEVATETIMDHSKSIKTVLMKLFKESNNHDIEGIDTINACYAGTNALFNTINWIESSSYDGRLAIVVVCDIAEYAKGSARPTSGAGAVAMLIGPNAPIIFDSNVRSTYMDHTWDFYKPNLASPYPVVDGKFSNLCYLNALDQCYKLYSSKYKKKFGVDVSIDTFDYVVFHAPYNKLVQKSYARLIYNDFLNDPTNPKYSSLSQFANLDRESSFEDKDLESAFVKFSKDSYNIQVLPSTLLPVQLGNMYTASLYGGLTSLLYSKGKDIANKRILMFSYGSGLAASMFSFYCGGDENSLMALENIKAVTNIESRLDSRIKCDPKFFNEMMEIRDSLHHNTDGFIPTQATDNIVQGTYYLKEKDRTGKRENAQI